MPGPHDLTDRVAVVTGAASGIGRATALRLTEAGATVVCADQDLDGATNTARLAEASAGHAEAHAVDVTDATAVTALVTTTAERRGSLDIMVNVAGITHTDLVADLDEADLDRVFAVNVKGTVFGCRAAARVMTRQSSGCIVNITSTAIDIPRAGMACYAMSKAAVAQLTRTLAAELGPAGIRVNAVAPGLPHRPPRTRPHRNHQLPTRRQHPARPRPRPQRTQRCTRRRGLPRTRPRDPRRLNHVGRGVHERVVLVRQHGLGGRPRTVEPPRP